MIVKAAIGFLATDSDEELIADVQSAITGLTGNADFPTPAPALTSIETALTAFTVALAEAANGGTAVTSIKNAKRAELVSLMRQLASYVTVTADGDMTKLLSSGFRHQKPTRSTIGTLPTPSSPVLRRGMKSGQLEALALPLYGAYTYNWRIAIASAPSTFVQTAQTTAARNTFEDLTPGQIYNVQVCAVGAAGVSDWSDAAELMVV